MIQDACDSLFKRMRKYADQLECLDALHHDAELAAGHVVLALSHDACAQDRLETLLSETGRLKLAAVEAKCGCSANVQSPIRPDPRGICGHPLFLALLWGACFFFVLLVAGTLVQP